MSEIIKQDISEKLTDSFMNYAMYVIVDRALPDIRDGLKPVQRRILYSMNNLGLNHNKSYKKSARTVGDVLGMWHPHGDSSVYEAMAKMVQSYNMRYPLVDGHGNFGSIDGDSPAAMRYTEARMSYLGESMLKDINKNTVDYDPNFDDSDQEPTLLPTLFPNLLANGTTGIAVSMSTSIPPHNAQDLYTALKLIVSNALKGEEVSDAELIDIIQAPDFPTGAQIINLSEVKKAYLTGKGRVVTQSTYKMEDLKGREQIVFDQIPFKVNKSKIIEKIDELRKTSLDDIKEVRDESDKDGIRVVVELKKGANSSFILKRLFKQTSLEESFSINMVALVGNRPKQFTLKEALEEFLAHVAQVITRKTAYDMQKAEARKHIVEGILSCLDQIDEVVAVIKTSRTNAEISDNLQEAFGLSKEQAKYIADMRLKSLSQASHQDYKMELESLTADIEKWNAILVDEHVLLREILHQLEEVSSYFKEGRRTQTADLTSDVADKELIKEESLIFTMTERGVAKSVRESDYATKGRGTKGSKGQSMKDDDSISYMISVNSRDDLLFFTNQGRCHLLEAHQIPITTKAQSGKYINNYIDLDQGEEIVNVIAKRDGTKGDLIFATAKGIGKRLSLENLSSVRKVTKVITFKEEDELVSVMLFDDEEPADVVALTALGQAVRFSPHSESKGIRQMGRTAAGVRIVNLVGEDYVVGTVTVGPEKDLFLVTENGYGKRVNFNHFSTMNRGVKGVRAISVSEKSGALESVSVVSDDEDIFIATKQGILSRISASTIRPMGRSAAGVKIISLSEDDTVQSVSTYPSETEEEEAS